VWSVKCEVLSVVECGVWSVKKGVWRVECVKCKVWSEECGV